MADDKQVITVIKNDLSWLQAHERLIIVFLALLVGGWFLNKYIDNAAADAKTKAGIAQTEADNARQDALQARSAFQGTLEVMARANQALVAAAAQREAILATKQQQIQTLPLPELAVEWKRLTPVAQIIATDAGLTIDAAGARDTVSQLETVPVLKADKIDLQTQVSNSKTEVTACRAALTADEVQISKDDTACKLKVDAEKKAGNKKFKNGLIIGFIAGLGTRFIAKF